MAAMPYQHARSTEAFNRAICAVRYGSGSFFPEMVLMARTLLSRFFILGLLGLSPLAQAASLDGLAVQVTNTSEPVLCAEKDNVAVNFASPAVKSFRIEAVHPAYMG